MEAHCPHCENASSTKRPECNPAFPDIHARLCQAFNCSSTFIVTAVAATIAASLALALQVEAVLELVTHLIRVVVAVRHGCWIAGELQAQSKMSV